jgi:hypothetical protein
MMKDPALERIWKARDVLAKRAGYDAKTLVAQLKEAEAEADLKKGNESLAVVREGDVPFGQR